MQKSALAIIVPYRDRAEHWAKFLPFMRRRFFRAGINALIIRIDQADDLPFNRGALLNVGAHYARANCPNAALCFHDVDMLPATFVDYALHGQPFRHLASACSQFGHKMPMREYFGGVTMAEQNAFWQSGGYPWDFWGWGAEDDAFCVRAKPLGIDWTHGLVFESMRHDRHINGGLLNKNEQRLKSVRAGGGTRAGDIAPEYTAEQREGFVLVSVDLSQLPPPF